MAWYDFFTGKTPGPEVMSSTNNQSSGSNFIEDFLFGKDPSMEKFRLLDPEQEQFQKQFMGSNIPQALQFLQSFLSGDEESLKQYSAPFLRQFQTQVVPNITERFGGGESGGSSGLMNALAEAGAGLEGQLASDRQKMGLSAAGQLGNFGQMALQPRSGFQSFQGQQGLAQMLPQLLPLLFLL